MQDEKGELYIGFNNMEFVSDFVISNFSGIVVRRIYFNEFKRRRGKKEETESIEY